MSYTTKEQLTHTPDGELVITPEGNKDKQEGTLYYAKDLDKVMEQKGFVKLKYLNVLFERIDATNNNIHDLTVMAGVDTEGNILNIMALPWPPYYIDQNPLQYRPGFRLTK